MGYKKSTRSDRLSLPSNPEYWVEMKAQVLYGDERAAQEAMVKMRVSENGNSPGDAAFHHYDANSGRSLSASVEMGAYFQALMCRLITAWNLDDEEGNPLPITLASLDDLDGQDGNFLMKEVHRRQGHRPREDDVPFGKGSSSESKATKSRTQPPPRR